MAALGSNDANMNRRRAINFLALIVKDLIESSSSSSDSEEELDALYNLKIARWRKVPRLKNYVEEVIPRWRNKEFQSHFR